MQRENSPHCLADGILTRPSRHPLRDMNTARFLFGACPRPVLLIAIFLAGCGGPDRPPMAEATGTVTFQDQPLEGATVVFAPTSGERVATGETDDAGRFTLGTFGHEDGAIIGDHRVTVIARHAVARDESGGSSMPGGPTAAKPSGPRIPTRYFDPESSGLTAAVTDGGDNDFQFDLTE